MIRNIHYNYATICPIQVATLYTSDIDATAGVQAYVKGVNSASPVIHSLWFLDTPPDPFTTWTISALVENTSGSDAATLRFDIASDPWVSGGSPGTSVDINVAASTSAWTEVTGDLSMPSGATDTIRMWALNGATGEVRVHSVTIRPKAITTIAAGKVTVGSYDFVPHDDGETDQDSACSVHLRQTQWNNCEFIRRSRLGTIVGWSENPQFRAGSESFKTTASAYETVARIPYYAPPGVTKIRWGLFGYRSGSTGAVELTTDYMSQQSTSSQEITLGATWTTPYSSMLYHYTDGTHGDLTCREDAFGELIVRLKGDGSSNARLLSLTAWFEPLTA